MKWYIIVLAAAGAALLAGCSGLLRTQPPDTEPIDGGTRHYLDEDAPKTIESTQIVSFSCEFSTTNLSMNSSPIAGRYYTLYAGEDGGNYEARGGGTVYGQRIFTPDKAFFEALQAIVTRYDFAQHNGQFYKVSGLPPDYGVKLDIQYASGESIRASNNQDCFLSLEAMEELISLFGPDESEQQEQP